MAHGNQLYEIIRAQSGQIVFLQNTITEQQNQINRLLKSAPDTPISRDTKSILDYNRIERQIIALRKSLDCLRHTVSEHHADFLHRIELINQQESMHIASQAEGILEDEGLVNESPENSETLIKLLLHSSKKNLQFSYVFIVLRLTGCHLCLYFVLFSCSLLMYSQTSNSEHLSLVNTSK